MELRVENLCKSFEKKNVLCDASFNFESGKIYGLLGRNGAGKTTFFNCINQDLLVDSGEFYFYDGESSKVNPTDIGYVISTPTVPEFLTGREFLKFYLEINKNQIPNPKNTEEYFDIINLSTEDRGRLMKDYSHGMKNKMQMLCLLISKPPVILLDEPLTSLDVVAAHEMKELLLAMKKDHIIILSTHILQLAQDLCDEIVLLHQGKLSGVDDLDCHDQGFEEHVMELLSR